MAVKRETDWMTILLALDAIDATSLDSGTTFGSRARRFWLGVGLYFPLL